MKKRLMVFALVMVMVLGATAPALAYIERPSTPIEVTTWEELRAATPLLDYAYGPGGPTELVASIVIKAGSSITVPAGANLTAYTFTKIVVEKGATLEVLAGQTVKFEGGRFELYGNLVLNSNSVVEVISDGQADIQHGKVTGNGKVVAGRTRGEVFASGRQFRAGHAVSDGGDVHTDWDLNATIAGFDGPTEVWADDDEIVYTLWVDTIALIENANAFTFDITKSGLLDYVGAEVLLPGFSLLTAPDFVDKNTELFTFGIINDDIDIPIGKLPLLKLTFTPAAAGDADLKLDEAFIASQLSADVYQTITEPDLSEGYIDTLIKPVPDDVPVYSPLDVNKDEVIDFSDIAIVLRGVGLALDDPARLSTDMLGEAIFAADLDVNDDGSIDISDIADVLANYGPAPKEMVDPRTL